MAVVKFRKSIPKFLIFGSKRWVLVTLKTECTQGSFLKRIHARVFLGTNVRNHNDHFDRCTQGSFWPQMRTTPKEILSYAHNGLLGNGGAKCMGQIPDTRNLQPRCRQTVTRSPRTTSLLRTTCNRSCCNWSANCVAA